MAENMNETQSLEATVSNAATHQSQATPASTTGVSPAISSLDPTDPLGSTLLETDRSLLRKWLTELKNLDVDPERVDKWKKIGWEVFERKALLIAAARDLKENQVPDPMKLAATDIFVEKAQRILTERANWLYRFGAATAVLAICALCFAAWHVFGIDTKHLLQVESSKEGVSNAYLTVLILKSTTAGGFIVAVVYILVSLSRALLHEATVLYNRRHSLRFGRLFVYLMSGSMTREDLEAVFNWNAEFSTAFRDIQAENITKSPLMKLLETPAEMLKSGTEMLKTAEGLVKEVRGKKEPGKTDG